MSLTRYLFQQKYGKGVVNLTIVGIEIRGYASSTQLVGIPREEDLNSAVAYGRAISVARVLRHRKYFTLTEFVWPTVSREGRNVSCGAIPELPTISARIVIDEESVDFLAELSSPLLIGEGKTFAHARVPGLAHLFPKSQKIFEIFFLGKPVIVK